MCQIAVQIPDEVLYDTKMSRRQAMDFARQTVAVGYYTMKGVSLGYATQIADMSKQEFISYLGQNKISIFNFEDEDEFAEELSHAFG